MFERLIQKTESYVKTDIRYLLRGGSWLVGGQAVSSFTGFFLALAFANLISPQDYGMYKYVISTFVLLLIPSLSGMVGAMTQAVARGAEGDFDTAFKTRLKWGLIGAVASLGLGIYYLLRHNVFLGSIFLILAPFVPFFDSLTLYYSLLNGKQKFGQSTIYTSITQVLTSISIILTLIATRNVFLVIIVYVLSWTLFRGIAYLITRKEHELNTITDKKVIPYGKHLTFMNILALVTQQLDTILLFQYIGAQQLAYYSLATAIPDQFKSLAKNSQALIIPKYATQSKETAKYSVQVKWLKFFFFLVLVTIVYILAAPLVFTYLFPKYIPAIGLSQLYSISILGLVVVLPLSLFQSQIATKQLYLYNTVRSIVQIILLVSLMYFFKLPGVIYSRILSDFFALGYATYLARYY